MPGVRITVIIGRDTAHLVTNSAGQANYTASLRSDSLIIITRHLGYKNKSLSLRVPPNERLPVVHIQLVEEPQELAEIFVAGEALAVVIKGDTVQFNAKAFETFVNDPMAQLFDVLPGMEFVDGQLTYLGEPIHRVTIDGQRLFGDHVALSLEHIRADEIVDVRVFKEASDQDKLYNTPNPERFTVADVRTRTKPRLIRHGSFEVAAGTSIGPKHEIGEFEDDTHTLIDASKGMERDALPLYRLASRGLYSRPGKTLSLDFKSTNGRPASKQYRIHEASFLFNQEEANHFKISSQSKFGITKNAYIRRTIQDYLLGEESPSRSFHQLQMTDNNRNNWETVNRLSYTFENKSIVGTHLSLYRSSIINNTLSGLSMLEDGTAVGSQQVTGRNREIPINLRSEISYFIPISSVRLNTALYLNWMSQDGNGRRMDTLSSSSSPIHIVHRGVGSSRNIGGRIGARLLFKPTIHLHLTNETAYTHSRSKRQAVDELTGEVDLTDAFDYLVHEASNKINSELIYRNDERKTGIHEVRASVDWEHRNMLRDEHIPNNVRLPKSFNPVGASAAATYRFATFSSIKMRYTRLSQQVSLLHYMDLDASNPLILRAGNPNLDLPILNQITAEGSFIKGASAYQFRIEYRLGENDHVERSRYFSTEMYLPQYDYTAQAGSTLVTVENVSGREVLGLNGNYSLRSSFLQSNIRTALNYSYQHIPTFIQDRRATIIGRNIGVSLRLIGNFSSLFMPTVSWKASAMVRNHGVASTRRDLHELEIGTDLMLSDAWEVRSSNQFKWNVQQPHVSNLDKFGLVSNITLSYLFDSQAKYAIKIEGYDLFDKTPRVGINVFDEYIRSMYSYNLGRYFLAGVSMRF